jgi:hypothetical protein
MVGFCLARFMYLNFDKNFCPSTPSGDGNGAAPGECYYFLNFDRYKIGILLHLASVLPAGILAVMQFTPYIRHRWIMVHRISGYFAILLYTISLVGALMIARHSFGGGLDVQAWIGFVGIGVLVCFVISYINIRRLQIEQHRAWMLRGWFYVSGLYSKHYSAHSHSTGWSNHHEPTHNDHRSHDHIKGGILRCLALHEDRVDFVGRFRVSLKLSILRCLYQRYRSDRVCACERQHGRSWRRECWRSFERSIRNGSMAVCGHSRNRSRDLR